MNSKFPISRGTARICCGLQKVCNCSNFPASWYAHAPHLSRERLQHSPRSDHEPTPSYRCGHETDVRDNLLVVNPRFAGCLHLRSSDTMLSIERSGYRVLCDLLNRSNVLGLPRAALWWVWSS